MFVAPVGPVAPVIPINPVTPVAPAAPIPAITDQTSGLEDGSIPAFTAPAI